ncbi:MAG TPA: GNAT family N-acetyltransferase [Vicinamibacterales bacterium]|nr:GNAT family N-acetyltransferase [Vicinamibacterales bacterium]
MRSLSSPPAIDVDRVHVDSILGLREEYRREMACQIVHDSWHSRGFTTSYLLRVNGDVAGYASVGGAPCNPKDTVKEFFVLPAARGFSLPLFRKLLAVSEARTIEAQTNDVQLALMLYECAVEWQSETILFADAVTTCVPAPDGVILRSVTALDRPSVFPHTVEPVGDWGLEHDGQVAATGGILFHYNPPYGDIYMEVAAPHRGRGFGSYLVQELKRICRETGHIPAARCHQDNRASRRALERAGMFPCARILHGRIPA